MAPKKDIERKLNQEIKKREAITDSIIKDISKLNRKLLSDVGEYKIWRQKRMDEIGQLEKVKAELLSYTLRIVTMIVGLLGVILTITYLTLNVQPEGNFLWFCVSIILFFIFIFILWFVLWIKNEEIFKFIDTDHEIEIPDKKTKKIMPMLNWLIVVGILVISFFNFVIIGKIFSIESYIYWDYFIHALAVVFIALVINYAPHLNLLKGKLVKASRVKLFILLVAIFILEMIFFIYHKYF